MSRKRIFFLFVLSSLIIFAGGILFYSVKGLTTSFTGCGCDFIHATGDFALSEKLAYFEGREIIPPQTVFEESMRTAVLGENSEEKWIEVDLSEQKLIAWNGQTEFLETPISSGKWAPTPTGEFRIWGKYKYIKMSGGKKENNTYYYLPNVPYTMFFYKGFGLHGTYWHNNFGVPMSHGCVNLPTLMAEKLFYWTEPQLPVGKNLVLASKDNPGTRIVIHE